jgi:hypothetical protein
MGLAESGANGASIIPDSTAFHPGYWLSYEAHSSMKPVEKKKIHLGADGHSPSLMTAICKK